MNDRQHIGRSIEGASFAWRSRPAEFYGGPSDLDDIAALEDLVRRARAITDRAVRARRAPAEQGRPWQVGDEVIVETPTGRTLRTVVSLVTPARFWVADRATPFPVSTGRNDNGTRVRPVGPADEGVTG